MPSMNCPNCQSEDWKLASVIYAEGTTTVEASTSGSTLGVGAGTGGLGVGYAMSSSNTLGSHRTLSSQAAAPPVLPPHPGPKITQSQKNTATGAIQFVAICLGLVLIFKESMLFGVIGLVLVFVYWGKLKFKARSLRLAEYKSYEEEYAKKTKAYDDAVTDHAKWERTRICQRCGTRFTIASPRLLQLYE